MKAANWIACTLALCAAAPVHAKNKPDAAASDDDATATDDVTSVDDDDSPAKQKARQGGDTAAPLQKQDLNGHDLGGAKKLNVFERDRFFVDKADTAKTEKGTLIQGSLALTVFGYHESGDTIPGSPATAPIPSNSPFNRLFTDLRLQTDFRHIGGGRWDARIDVRGRLVNNPDSVTTPAITPVTDSKIQSGFLGDNELEIREAWLVRNGIQSDVFLGRQFIPDLGGIKIDGLRIDYASSAKFTLLGFGGLYPIRGSRSITDDYTPLKSEPAADGSRSDAGRFVGAGGFGAAYRTPEAYGSFGGVVLAPLSSESPRVFGTSTGYWRYGSKLDFYHFAILDLVGSNAVNTGLTNLSLGVNYKPDQRLRGTLSFNRVDTDTLNVQAQAFLTSPDPGTSSGSFNAVQNEAYFQRIATNEGRASLSAGLGELQRYEVTAALTYRYRGDITISASPQIMAGVTPMTFALKAEQAVELYGSIIDRRSFKDLRLGLDGSRSFGVGSVSYEHTTALQLRAFAGRELANGHGEWEAEVAYSSTKDDDAGTTCDFNKLGTCYGAAQTSIISIGGTLYYRINRDWFVIGSAFLNRSSISHIDPTTTTDDPAVIGISGYGRIAYRF